MEVNKSIRKRVQFTLWQWRVFNGLSQQQLANKLNVSKQSVWNWENGIHYPHATKMQELAELFGIKAEQIIIEKDKRK